MTILRLQGVVVGGRAIAEQIELSAEIGTRRNINVYGAGTFGNFVNPLYEDHKGNLWVTSQAALWRWAPGLPERYTPPHGVTSVLALTEDDSGALLLGTTDGLKQLVAGKIENYTLPGVTGQFTAASFLRTRDDSLWIGTNQGLLHWHPRRVDVFGTIDGLSGDHIHRLFEDREGSVWVATPEGIDRFREYPIATISRKQGLFGSYAWSVQAAADGSVWIGTPDSLNRWTNGRLAVYRSRGVLGQSRRADDARLNIGGTETEVSNSGLAGSPQSLGLDDEGRLWASTSDGMFYLEGNRFVRVSGIPGGATFSIAGDGSGNVWILRAQDLFHWSPSATVQRIPWSQFGQKTGRTMLPDREAGGLWLGFLEGGVVYLKDSKIVRSYGATDGLDGRVNHLRLGPNRGLWVSNEGGLSRIKDGHIATLSQKNGLPCDEVHWSMEDKNHDVWLYMPCGLVRIARSELDAWINDPKHILKTMIFDSSDGVMSVGVYGAIGPHVTRAADGRIWFVPGDGASVLDPRHIPFNKLPPPVHIEQIVANHQSYPLTSEANGNVPCLR